MSRYNSIKLKRGNNGKSVYRPHIYPNIPKRDNDIYVATQTGDRLDLLAYQYYGDSSLWWIIASANNIHDAPLGILDGTILRIPQNWIEIQQKFSNS
jgi:phage tail protein X